MKLASHKPSIALHLDYTKLGIHKIVPTNPPDKSQTELQTSSWQPSQDVASIVQATLVEQTSPLPRAHGLWMQSCCIGVGGGEFGDTEFARHPFSNTPSSVPT
eukprot:3549423-Amphidinium_carterae.1